MNKVLITIATALCLLTAPFTAKAAKSGDTSGNATKTAHSAPAYSTMNEDIEWAIPPIPPRKPAPPQHITDSAQHIENAQQAAPAPQADIIIPPNPRDLYVISQNTAIGIALEHAPPSREYKVAPYDFKGTPAYSVMFRTENGSYEVIIGAVSGRVLDKGYLQ